MVRAVAARGVSVDREPDHGGEHSDRHMAHRADDHDLTRLRVVRDLAAGYECLGLRGWEGGCFYGVRQEDTCLIDTVSLPRRRDRINERLDNSPRLRRLIEGVQEHGLATLPLNVHKALAMLFLRHQ